MKKVGDEKVAEDPTKDWPTVYVAFPSCENCNAVLTGVQNSENSDYLVIGFKCGMRLYGKFENAEWRAQSGCREKMR